MPGLEFLGVSNWIPAKPILEIKNRAMINFKTSRSEARAIFYRRNKRLDHLGIDEIAVELIQLRQPEVVAGVVSVRAAVWIAPQVTEELHQHESAVEFIVL